ncbi:ChaB family protein [Roseomonas sp. E05]|uniref:ChaB family protein n=1 Tax=Roseomonas sp. E05 TaxID=3046310 RepID=UPI0024BB1C53|nr:ChaB family protein [Roseomonas sp. E05]MDJ0390111.1 ChaB family protein [Roseomonas sp. E05]
MPYRSNRDLPENLRRILPEHAQDIYRAAFNHAWAGLERAEDEAAARRIAWGAVKRSFRKVEGRWVPKP